MISANKSKPVYASLSADMSGRHHLMLGLGRGAAALRRVVDELATDAPSLTRTRVLVARDWASKDASIDGYDPISAFGNMQAPGLHAYDDADALLDASRDVFKNCVMGTRLYVAGPESFIGRALQIALEFNLNKDEVRAEAIGSLARRVRCVHCRAITEAVRTNIAQCSGCARWLQVRDHYSRRIAAYMGVMVDAEAPGELPSIDEIYS